MSLNVYFTNFSDDDFQSKNKKKKMKEFIKSNVNKNDISKLDNLKNELINNFLKKETNIQISLTYQLKGDDLEFTINKKDFEKLKKEQLREKLKDKIKNSRNTKMTQKEFLQKEKDMKIILNSDSRVTQDMKNKYNIARKTINPEIPSPVDILEDKDKYVNEIFQHILNLSKKCESKEKLIEIMDNNYINYVQTVCGFDYKIHLDKFFRKINEMSDSNSEVPTIIQNTKDNIVNIKELDESTLNKLEDSDEENNHLNLDNKNNDINSDDESEISLTPLPPSEDIPAEFMAVEKQFQIDQLKREQEKQKSESTIIPSEDIPAEFMAVEKQFQIDQLKREQEKQKSESTIINSEDIPAEFMAVEKQFQIDQLKREQEKQKSECLLSEEFIKIEKPKSELCTPPS